MADTRSPASLTAYGAGPDDGLRAYLDHLLSNPIFAASSRRGRLLRYLVDGTLAGEGDRITEFGIGLDVFEKPPSFDTRIDSSVRAEMSRLRRVLSAYYEDSGRNDPWRVEFPKRGYVPRFVPVAPGGATGRRRTLPFHRTRITWVAAMAVATAGMAVAWRAWYTQPAVRSVVILPFENLTGDAAEEYLADGVTEELTDWLAQVPDLRVVARTSAFQFKGKKIDVRQVGRQLDVDAVVEGSVRRNDRRLVLTVQVNRARDGVQLVSRTLEGGMQELGRLERNLEQPVRAAIRVRSELPDGHVPTGEARELFLKARAIGGKGSLEAFESAVTYLNRAIESDPSYADAYAALASVYANAAVNFTSEPLQYAPSAKAAAARALELDPLSGRAYAALGYLDGLVLLDWSRSEQELRRAIPLMPEARHWLGITLVMRGRFAEGLKELRAAEELDPLSPAAAAMVGQALYLARRYDEALRQYNKVLQLHPDSAPLYPHLGAAYEAKGEFEKAMAQYQLFVSTTPSSPKYAVAHLLAVMGRRDEARRMLDEILRPSGEEQSPDPFSVAIIYCALDERDRAFQWLDRAFEARKIALLKVHPMLDPLRADPRFQALLNKTGLDR